MSILSTFLLEPTWIPAPEHPCLPANQLHIWRARMQYPHPSNNRDSCAVFHDRSEKIQAALFRNDVLQRYARAESEPRVPRIFTSPGPRLHVAAAQCDHLALIAVSWNARGLGLDLERVREDLPFDEMADGFLDARAQWDLRITWSLREKAWKFFQFWTTNEACAQACPTSRSTHTHQVRGFSPEADFIAALAIDGGPEADVLYWDWQSQAHEVA